MNEHAPSKTAVKKHMHHLQQLGMALTELSDNTLKKIGLSEDLYQAVRDYRSISANGARKRQAQYIGRLMRDTDPAPIQAFLDTLKGENQAHNAFLQRVEHVRSRLLAEDGALTEFVAEHPAADAAQLHTLIRNARKEQAQNKPPKHFRALYRALKETMAQQPAPAAESDHENPE
ncbi:ribosome biogenesis factor YjgA [Conchiformibius kuhniae]|uniref:Dual-action ribosomal maturation protein DarP n=1 Tax=Conchiformibius kuhniae TaxID=211502 RepID=A0A8T9MV19_9NEIS|nr:ribosome biogenesis factor YjgA [Conchiformibius kuhniae]UOP05710.1 DUF615 domain-containing protein [Conchiformibius kuhniae]